MGWFESVSRKAGYGAVVLACLWTPVAAAAQIANVFFPDTARIEGREMTLVQVDLKEKFFLDLYVWGLYLEEVVANTDEALASKGSKQLHFKMKRKLSREQLVEGIREGLADSPEMQLPHMRERLEAFIRALSAVNAGDSLIISYVAGEGTYVSGRVTEEAFIPGKDFADALFATWLSEHPLI